MTHPADKQGSEESSWLDAALERHQPTADPVFSPGAREEIIRRYAPARSFLDVGGMWVAEGRDSFVAEASGATAVTMLDCYKSEGFFSELDRRSSQVRFVFGDLNDPVARTAAGKHDVVWCAGVLYHMPNPFHSLLCLRELTREFLILLTFTIPEVPGVEQACVFWPGLGEASRSAYAKAYERLGTLTGPLLGLRTPFVHEEPINPYGNFWWGLSSSAIGAMIAILGGEVTEIAGDDFFRRFVFRFSS